VELAIYLCLMEGSYGRFQATERIHHLPTINGATYRAVDSATNRSALLHVVGPEDCTVLPDQIASRFYADAYAARRLMHPHIAEFIDFGAVGADGYTLFVAYEWTGGRTLRGLLDAEGPQSSDAAREILRPMAAALDYAHGQGVVHGHLCPDFVWLADDRLVKIAGFGFAKAYYEMAWPRQFGYMEPRQLTGMRSSSPSADQFSLAVIAYEILAGRQPFTGENWRKPLSAVTQQQPTPVHKVNPAIPKSMWGPLGRVLVKDDPDLRFASCGEFVKALDL